MITRFKDFLKEEVDFTLEDESTEETPLKDDKPAKDDVQPATDDSGDKFKKLKEDLNKLLEETGNREDIIKRSKDESIEALNIKKFNQDSDVYDFYLAHQFEIDEKLNEENFFDSKMSELGITGLYNAVIIGTQFAVKKLIQEL